MHYLVFISWAAILILFSVMGQIFLSLSNQTDSIDGSQFSAPALVVNVFGESVASIYPALVIATFTLLGIVSQVIWVHSRLPDFKLSLRLFAPVIISPIVLYGTYTVVKDHPDGFVAALIAFQNGFFWQTVLEKASKEGTGEH